MEALLLDLSSHYTPAANGQAPLNPSSNDTPAANGQAPPTDPLSPSGSLPTDPPSPTICWTPSGSREVSLAISVPTPSPSPSGSLPTASLALTQRDRITMATITPPQSLDSPAVRATCGAHCLVIDVSYSMEASATVKSTTGDDIDHGFSVLDIAKHAMCTYVTSLSADDWVAVASNPNPNPNPDANSDPNSDPNPNPKPKPKPNPDPDPIPGQVEDPEDAARAREAAIG